MTKNEKKELNTLRTYYNQANNYLKKCEKGNSSKNYQDKIISALKNLNKESYFDFDDEIDAIKTGHGNYKNISIAIAEKFRNYLKSHVDFNTKHALDIIKRDLDKADYTKHFDKRHYYKVFLETLDYLQPCGDVTSLRDDLAHGRYFNLKGDIKTIKSNREDLMKHSHTGNIKGFLGKTEAKSVAIHND